MHEECGVEDFSEADRDAMEAREDVWRMSGGCFLKANMSCCENIACTERVVIPIPLKYIGVVRQLVRDLWELEFIVKVEPDPRGSAF